ncbi:SH3 domain-containing protein [Salibaculum sp.]|uniref:SH3 domain-containing protein n=1 Tax=Salibaculum sp. TaxID=2855480 RepID=UPI002B48B960|nr:SH3 domain-containing protein [Salibaculum sp.]HKL68223.1 SH3 domain-containing protein [Salibaculum sp.]
MTVLRQVLACVFVLWAGCVPAQDAAGPAATTSETRGPVTNLPLPRFVSLKANEANVRRGPSLSHRIDWVFKRRDMPLQVIAEYGHWRRVTDHEGMGGWVHYSLLSGNRTVIVQRDMLPLLARPVEASPQTAILERGVIAELDECSRDWCRLVAGGHRGWASKPVLWGVFPHEIRE